MHKKLLATLKPLLKPLVVFGLVVTLFFSHADGALAARGGGRIGGGSFRAPTRTYSPPTRTYQPPSGRYYPGGGYGYGYPGGGFGFPFLVPIFSVGGGFGGLFTLLIFLSIAGFLVRSFSRTMSGDDSLGYDDSYSPTVSVAKVQVGLLSEARSLQADLDRIARTADTSSSEGLTQVLQETTLALLRHPEYWVYAGAENQKARLEAAELQFNRLALAERSKFSEETLSNVNNQLRQAPARGTLPAAGGQLTTADLSSPGEYIVTTVLVAAQGQLQLPEINSSQDLRRALGQIGAIPSDKLLAVEVLWTPQANGDTLSSDELIAEYPDLKLV